MLIREVISPFYFKHNLLQSGTFPLKTKGQMAAWTATLLTALIIDGLMKSFVCRCNFISTLSIHKNLK